MNLIITKVIQDNERYRVHFECQCGSGCAVWVGNPPPMGESRNVEFEITEPLTLGKEVTETVEPIGMRLDRKGMVLVGEFTTIDDDGFARMDVGCGGVDLEFVGSQPLCGKRYRVDIAEMKAFDCAY